MENKKQLIIMPPMSQALKKLNEVLEGISEDENIEISLIDDLRELSQFVATTGQCLILASNAKKCATFLQDNKSMLAKNHVKTILFTPKEIPEQTLTKFTNIGLTESILENSPPKTFLYKVKLLLRSIKTPVHEENSEKILKAIEVNKALESSKEHEIRERNLEIVENVNEIEKQGLKINKEINENLINLGNPLKDETKSKNESIHTHWRTNRKKDDDNKIEESNYKSSITNDNSNIDTHYRGKLQKSETSLGLSDDLNNKNKVSLDIENEKEIKKKSSNEKIDERSIIQNRLHKLEEKTDHLENQNQLNLELLDAQKKKKKLIEDDETTALLKTERPLENLRLQKETEDKTFPVDNLGGYLKGKINNQQLEIKEDLFEEKKHNYDNSELDKKNENSVEVTLESSDKKKLIHEDKDSETESPAHEGAIDKIDNNMIGDSNNVDKIRTRMYGKSSLSEKTNYEEPHDQNAKISDIEQGLKEKDNKVALDISNDSKASARTKEEVEVEVENETTGGLYNASLKLLSKEKNQKWHKSIDDKKDKNSNQADLSSLPKEEKVGSEHDSSREKQEKSQKQIDKTELNLEKNKGKRGHASEADNNGIFSQNDLAAKKKDHSWDNLTDKKTIVALLPGKCRKDELPKSEKNEKADLPNTIIDYRKMKEEFDMISMDISNADNCLIKNSRHDQLNNDNDDGSFKVFEIEPQSLDFAINIINAIYRKDVGPDQIFYELADELVSTYHCYPVFFSYKLEDKKFSESYNCFLEMPAEKVSSEKKEWWMEKKKETSLFEYYQSKSMITWRCPDILQNGMEWEDVELPAWAEKELKSRPVELIFPYFDGIDRMGMAIVFFPEGLNSIRANGILTVLEMARTLFLDKIQKYQIHQDNEFGRTEKMQDPRKEINNIFHFFSGLFGKKKAS